MLKANIRLLYELIAEGKFKYAQDRVRFDLNNTTAEADKEWAANTLEKLNATKMLLNIPEPVKSFFWVEQPKSTPYYYLRNYENQLIEKTVKAYKVASKMKEAGISYIPSLLLNGAPGTGKTQLAREIAYQLDLPLLLVRFSEVVSSYLGSTQNNIAKIFDFVHTARCVLCLDEIDAIGMARGQKNDVGEMNRIVIALMQELDRLENDVIIIGTTNRADRLDDALSSRFSIRGQLEEMKGKEVTETAKLFFESCGVMDKYQSVLEEWMKTLPSTAAARDIQKSCKEKLAEFFLSEV